LEIDEGQFFPDLILNPNSQIDFSLSLKPVQKLPSPLVLVTNVSLWPALSLSLSK